MSLECFVSCCYARNVSSVDFCQPMGLQQCGSSVCLQNSDFTPEKAIQEMWAEMQPKVYVAGEEGSPLKSVTGHPVRIEEIRAKHKSDNLYHDADFPAGTASIGDIEGFDASSFSWVRPQEICKAPLINLPRPEFAVVQDCVAKSKCSEYDIVQGGLGDCWFLSGLQALAGKPKELAWVIPEDNYTGFDEEKYCGAFHFRFYIMADAKWVDVVVDDLLPVDSQGLPVFAKIKTKQTPDQCEFWVALVEKAYAKLHGTYAGIVGGCSSQALENLSGGFSEIVGLKQHDTRNLCGQAAEAFQQHADVLKDSVLTYIQQDSFMGLGTYSDGAPPRKACEEGYTRYGLADEHAYTILDVQEVNFKAPRTGSRVLLKIKNPWSTGEWKGAYSDADDFNWGHMDRDLRLRNKEGSTEIDEGVFWMDLHSVIHYFSHLEVCHFGMTSGTQLATCKGVWPAAIQALPDPIYTADMLRFKAYKFEVKLGKHPVMRREAANSAGEKAVVCFTLVLEGYNSALDPKLDFYADLYNMKAPDEDLERVYSRGPFRQVGVCGREASTWTFVDPGWWIIVPWISTTPAHGEDSAIPSEFRGKPITYALRVFTENVTSLEELSQAPKYEHQRPLAPDQIQAMVDQLRNLELEDIGEIMRRAGLDLGNLATSNKKE